MKTIFTFVLAAAALATLPASADILPESPSGKSALGMSTDYSNPASGLSLNVSARTLPERKAIDPSLLEAAAEYVQPIDVNSFKLVNMSAKSAFGLTTDFTSPIFANPCASSLSELHSAVAVSRAEGETTVTPVPMYKRPGTQLWGGIGLHVTGATDPSQDGDKILTFYNPVGPLGSTTYLNYTYELSDAGLSLSSVAPQWSVAVWDSQELIKDITSTERHLTYEVTPPVFKGTSLKYPTLTLPDEQTYTYSHEEKPYYCAAGGSLRQSEDDYAYYANYYSSQFPGATVTGFEAPYRFNNPTADSFKANYYGTYFTAGVMSAGFEDAPEITYSQNSNAYWAKCSGLSDAQTKAWCQYFEAPSSPLSISSATMSFWAQTNATANLNFTFYAVDSNGQLTNEVLASYTQTIEPTSSLSYITTTIPFETESDIDLLPFKLIDSGMMLMITGFDSEAFDMCSPFVACYTYDQTAPITAEPNSLYAIVSGTDDTGKASTMLTYPNYLLGGMTQNAFNISFDAFYPFMILGANCNDNTDTPNNEGDIVHGDNVDNIILKKAGDYVWVEFYLSADDFEELGVYNYDDPEAEQLPSWLEFGFDTSVQMYGDYEILPKYVYFGVAADAESVGEINLAFTYQGMTRIVHVGPTAAAGINTIEADAPTADVKVQGTDIIVNGTGNVALYNVAGQLVKQTVANGSAVIDAASLAKGIYVVRIANRTAKIVL